MARKNPPRMKKRNAKRSTAFEPEPKEEVERTPVFGERHLRHLLHS